MATHVDDREDLEPGLGADVIAPPASNEPTFDPQPEADPYAGYVDYFGFESSERWPLPDGRQWMEFKRLNEGERAKYLRKTRPDVTINSRSGDAKVPTDAAMDRRELILASVTDWHIVARDKRDGKIRPVAFSKGSPNAELEKWLNVADPLLVGELEKKIRMANPWMLQEMSVEQIDKEIADLTELRKVAAERELSEKNS